MTKPMRRTVHTINIKDNKTLREVIVAIDRRIKHLKVGLKALQRSEIPSHEPTAYIEFYTERIDELASLRLWIVKGKL